MGKNDKKYISDIYEIEDLKGKYHLNSRQLDYLINEDTFNSLHIEGNTLTRSEITVFIEQGITVHGKSFREYMQVRNYNFALRQIKKDVYQKSFKLNETSIKSIHRFLTYGELDDKYSGNYRDDFVFIRTTTKVPCCHELIPHKLGNILHDYYYCRDKYVTQFEKICKFKREFELIHPFFDGNGRTGRVLMNLLFLTNGYPYVVIPSDLRTEYFNSLEEDTFTEFMIDRMYESFRFIKNFSGKEEI